MYTFSRHALERCIERHIQPEEVLELIAPANLAGADATARVYRRGALRVVVDFAGNILTVYKEKTIKKS